MVEEVNNPGVTFAEGNAVDQFVTPNQVVYSFQGAGKAPDYPGNRHHQPRRNPPVYGGQVVSGPAGITGYIVGGPDARFKVVVRDPWPG